MSTRVTSMSEVISAPLHAFEVKVSIGANTKEYLIEALREILQTFEEGNIGNSCSGGWHGSYSVTSHVRNITPEDYRAELEQWRQGE